MLHVLHTFIKRIPREKFKSLSASALALVLVFLISIMYGVRDRQAIELENVMDNFEVRVEISDPINRETEGLMLRDYSIALFTDESAPHTVARFLRDTELRCRYSVYDPAEVELYIVLMEEWWLEVESKFIITDNMTAEQWAEIYETIPPPIPPTLLGSVYSITSLGADTELTSDMGVYIDYFDGYDESLFRTNEHVAVVSEALYSLLDPDNPVVTPAIWWEAIVDWTFYARLELKVVGIIHGASDPIIAPFFAVGELWKADSGESAYSDIMSAVISDNRLIDEFKKEARPYFVATGTVDSNRPRALTVFDSTYKDVVSNLKQNIMLITIATPFVFALSACIGFLASFLLTRRRKAEFAILRSIGVRKYHVFFGALAEQLALCVVGAAAGCALYVTVRGEFMPAPAAIFTACYTLGAAISAVRAAGADVLKILREKE